MPTDYEHALCFMKERDAARVEAAELRALFDLQRSRSQEAIARWRAAKPQDRMLTRPDMGDLLAWLMVRLDQAESDLARLRSAVHAYLRAKWDTPEDCGDAEGVMVDVSGWDPDERPEGGDHGLG